MGMLRYKNKVIDDPPRIPSNHPIERCPYIGMCASEITTCYVSREYPKCGIYLRRMKSGEK